MSFNEQNLQAFIELLNDRASSLFSVENLAELTLLVESLPDDIQEISIAISAWSEQYPKIYKAQLDKLKILEAQQLNNLPESNGERLPGTTVGNIPVPNYKLNKQVLQNAIQQSSSPSNSSSPPSSK